VQVQLQTTLYEKLAYAVAGAPGHARNQRLSALKPELYALRNAYRSNTVDVSYANIDRISAYLLAYFPHYVYMAYLVLRTCTVHLPQRKALNVAFFGGGPLPELIGLMEALRETQRLPDELAVNTYDVCDDWFPAVNEALTIAREFNPEVAIQVNCNTMDFRQQMTAEAQASLRGVNLVMFQNCCNEMVSSPFYQTNLGVLRDLLPVSTVFVLADQSKYHESVGAIGAIEAALQVDPRFDVLRSFSTADPEIRSPFTAPTDVRDNFFDGVNRRDPITGDWPPGQFERSKLSFSYVIARKLAS
jgi:hypothetical protein